MFFIPSNNWKSLFFIKTYLYSEIYVNLYVVALSVFYLLNSSTILILKFQAKAILLLYFLHFLDQFYFFDCFSWGAFTYYVITFFPEF